MPHCLAGLPAVWAASWSADLLEPRYFGWLLSGWVMTLWTALLASIASTVLGAAFAAMRREGSESTLTARLAAAFVAVFRNTPLLVQLFFWYFGAPALLPAAAREMLLADHVLHLPGLTLRWPSFEFTSALFGLVLYATAYVGEELRAGMRGVPTGQRLAALSLGFTPTRATRFVLLPQALRIALPPLIGQYMNIVKNTSLLKAVGVVELSHAARQVEAETFRTFQAFGVATALYVLTIATLGWAGTRVQRVLATPS